MSYSKSDIGWPAIEKGIEIPPKEPRNGKQSCDWTTYLRRLEIGDSFVWPTVIPIYNATYRIGIRVCARFLPKQATYRIWRVA